MSITTDKVDADVPSPGEGYLTKIGFEEGATVEIDTIIAVLSSSANGTSDPEPVLSAPEVASAAPAAPQASPAGDKRVGAEAEELRRTRSSPLVRKMAAEHDVDLAQLSGSGISGRVTKHDLAQYLQTAPATTSSSRPAPATLAGPRDNKWAYQPSPTDRLEPFSPMRASIAEHMVVSRQTSAHVTTVFEVDMTRVA